MWRAMSSKYCLSASGLMMSIVSCMVTSGCVAVNSCTLSPRMRSYDTFLNSILLGNTGYTTSVINLAVAELSFASFKKSPIVLVFSSVSIWMFIYMLALCLSIAFLKFLARVDLPMPGKPTGMRNKFLVRRSILSLVSC